MPSKALAMAFADDIMPSAFVPAITRLMGSSFTGMAQLVLPMSKVRLLVV
jgi:hypothetical protein